MKKRLPFFTEICEALMVAPDTGQYAAGSRLPVLAKDGTGFELILNNADIGEERFAYWYYQGGFTV